jgi:hypothetical protein
MPLACCGPSLRRAPTRSNPTLENSGTGGAKTRTGKSVLNFAYATEKWAETALPAQAEMLAYPKLTKPGLQ